MPRSGDEPTKIAVVGAGIAGMSAAFHIAKHSPPDVVEVCLIEAAEAIGGHAHTHRGGGGLEALVRGNWCHRVRGLRRGALGATLLRYRLTAHIEPVCLPPFRTRDAIAKLESESVACLSPRGQATGNKVYETEKNRDLSTSCSPRGALSRVALKYQRAARDQGGDAHHG